MTTTFRAALLITCCTALFTPAIARQDSIKTETKRYPPAFPQAKTTPPATHFTQGTIASIAADRVVINQKVRGKSQQVVFVLNSKTERSGNLVVGTRVTVQYREDNNQKIAAAVREFTPKATSSNKTGSIPGSKS